MSQPPAPAAALARKAPTPATAPRSEHSGGPDRDARRRAAVILEVLAGARSPTQAAAALGLSLPRYYQLELAALHGLVEGCQPQPRGRAGSSQAELTALRKRVQQLERDLARQQGLVRLTQRAVGLPAPAAPPTTKGPGKSKAAGRKARRPTVRALRAAARLRPPDAAPDDPPAAPEPAG